MSAVGGKAPDGRSLARLRAALPPDRRKYRRVPVSLLGRFMRANKQEYPCRTIDASVGDVAVLTNVIPQLGEDIVAYFDTIGGVRGKVARVFDGGFSIHLTATRHKREKLAAELTWLINQETFGTIDERRHERRPVPNTASTLSLGGGFEAKCRILDISVSGASLETTARPDVGTEVVLGKHVAIVRRHHEKGIGIQFLEVQDPLRVAEIVES